MGVVEASPSWGWGQRRQGWGDVTSEEGSGVGDGFVLPLPDAVELQEGGGVEVVDHGDHLPPPVAHPGNRGKQLFGNPQTG